MKNILILGSLSMMAQECVKCFAKDNVQLILLARNEQALMNQKNDLTVRYNSKVLIHACDLSDETCIDEHFKKITSQFLTIDVVLLAYGFFPSSQTDDDQTLETVHVNYLSAILWIKNIEQHFVKQGYGTLGVVTSVAGMRGRKSNYLYGSSKSALSTYVAGLSDKLWSKNIFIMDIRPGFVQSPMTQNIQSILKISNARAGFLLHKHLNNPKTVVYVPEFWRWIMCALVLLPRKIFRLLNI